MNLIVNTEQKQMKGIATKMRMFGIVAMVTTYAIASHYAATAHADEQPAIAASAPSDVARQNGAAKIHRESLPQLGGSYEFTGETMSDYYTFAARRAGLIVNSRTGQKMTQWVTRPTDTTHTDVAWVNPNVPRGADGKPASIEEWSIKSNCAGGKAFTWVDSYRSDDAKSSTQKRFKIATTRAEIRVGDGQWVDITGGGSCGTNGQPYALNDVTLTPYSLRVWGNIYKIDGTTVGRKFFWQHTLTYEPNAANPCWKQDALKTRPAIKHEEAWWDSVHGWAFHSSGSMGDIGQPDGVTVTYGRWQMVGKGVGHGWIGSFPGGLVCMQKQWAW